MKNTIKLLNNLRDEQSSKKNYIVSLEIGKIISSLLDESLEIHQQNYKQNLELIDKLTKQ